MSAWYRLNPAFLENGVETKRMNAPNAAGATIVVVDDEPVALEYCRHSLIRAGYNVYTASSGEEALIYFRANCTPVDLALVDVVMPGMSGIDLVQRLEKLNLATRIVLMSGYSPHEVQNILGKETVGYRSMWKPFEAATLVQRNSAYLFRFKSLLSSLAKTPHACSSSTRAPWMEISEGRSTAP